MAETTIEYPTLDEIIKQPIMPKIIVIGGGGLGKTTLVNNLTNAKFTISETTNDGTIDFQGASFNHHGTQILIVDSPGFRLNEDRWWNGILQIEKVIGVIVMHKYEKRNSGYGNFGYVLAYLNQQKSNGVIKFVLDHVTDVPKDNDMAGSISVKHSDHGLIQEDVQEWIPQLDETKIIQIYSPVALIKQYHNKLEEIRTLQRITANERQSHENIIKGFMTNIGELERNIAMAQVERRRVENERDELVEIMDYLPKQLANFDENSKGYQPDAPHATHYLYSWLPFVGMWHLKSLRTKAEKNHAIATGIIDYKEKRKKNINCFIDILFAS